MNKPMDAREFTEPERYELHEGPFYHFSVNRREFVQNLRQHAPLIRRQMAEHETYDELARPAGADVVGVFVNGVPLVAEQDYEVLPDRIHLKQPVKRRTSVSATTSSPTCGRSSRSCAPAG